MSVTDIQNDEIASRSHEELLKMNEQLPSEEEGEQLTKPPLLKRIKKFFNLKDAVESSLETGWVVSDDSEDADDSLSEKPSFSRASTQSEEEMGGYAPPNSSDGRSDSFYQDERSEVDLMNQPISLESVELLKRWDSGEMEDGEFLAHWKRGPSFDQLLGGEEVEEVRTEPPVLERM